MRRRSNLPKLSTTIFFVIIVLAFGKALGSAVDTHFDNQDSMLCNSAKVSGNEEYLNKCTCFYAGEDIRCIWEEK